MMRYPTLDLHELARLAGFDLTQAATDLFALYSELDQLNAANVRDLDLPCQRGCSACCHESVFVTPLEMLVAWDWAQQHLSAAERDGIVGRGLSLYRQHAALIARFEDPPASGSVEHGALARRLRFRCPLLGEDEACLAYPAREMYARLFGCSFQAPGALYACPLVGAHLANRTVKLTHVASWVTRLRSLPWTHKSQVYPYYFHWLYGDVGPGSH